jgi:hypothetical protein
VSGDRQPAGGVTAIERVVDPAEIEPCATVRAEGGVETAVGPVSHRHDVGLRVHRVAEHGDATLGVDPHRRSDGAVREGGDDAVVAEGSVQRAGLGAGGRRGGRGERAGSEAEDQKTPHYGTI